MKIQIFSDIHGDLRSLEKLLSVPADIYISAGDLSTFGKGLDACAPILSKQASRVWALPGNHETAAQNQEFCAAADFTDFHQQIRQIGSTNWAGLGYSNPTPFDTPANTAKSKSLRRWT